MTEISEAKRTQIPLVEAGVFLIDKPPGPTSFDMVRKVRKALHIKRVGHAGTLDPFASGLLIICVGRSATKLIPFIMEGDKEYEATLALGMETDTGDLEGSVVARGEVPPLDNDEVERTLSLFQGAQLQRPPRFSALKHEGKPLYYYARRGIIVEKEPRRIMIRCLEHLRVQNHALTIRVLCSKGTYIRSLAMDIGQALGCGAHLTSLRRTRSGFFSVKHALPGHVLADPGLAVEGLLGSMLTVAEVESRFKQLMDVAT